MAVKFRKFLLKSAVTLGVVLGVSQTHIPTSHKTGVAQAAVREAAPNQTHTEPNRASKRQKTGSKGSKAKTVLTRSASWFVYPNGCDTLRHGFDLVIHFHGAHS